MERRPMMPVIAGVLLLGAWVPLAGCVDEGKQCAAQGEDTCNGVDDDCDGVVDEDATFSSWYVDEDGDGYGAGEAERSCAEVSGRVAEGGDCDDADPEVHPGADEVCNGVDDDCDGAVDDADPSVTGATAWYVDGDGDGYGGGASFLLCDEPETGFSEQGGDCDDTDYAVNPGATETCDGIDDDCDGLVDDEDPDLSGSAVEQYLDADGDGYGDDATATTACELLSGHVEVGGDCDDGDAGVNPGATEICGDGIDQDCSGDAPECPPLDGAVARSSADAVLRSSDGYAVFGWHVAAGDLTGDGTDDLLLTESYANAVYLYAGLAPGDDLYTSDATAVAAGGDAGASYLGVQASNLEDADGDGYADFVTADANGSVFLYAGPVSAGARMVPDAELGGLATAGSYGGFDEAFVIGHMRSASSVELVVGDPGWSEGSAGSWAGAAWIVLGPVSAVSGSTVKEAATAVIEGIEDSEALGRVVTVGDLDGDGLDELVVGALSSSAYGATYGGAVYAFADGVPGTGVISAAEADTILYATATSANLGQALAADGDLDGDGYDDLVVGAPNDSTFGSGTGTVYVFSGPLSGGSHNAYYAADAMRYGVGGGYFGYSVDVVRDFDSDGADDLLVGELGYAAGGTSNAGALQVFYGPVEGRSSTPDATVYATSSVYYGAPVRGVGDLDGDGWTDVLVGSYSGTTVDLFFGGDDL